MRSALAHSLVFLSLRICNAALVGRASAKKNIRGEGISAASMGVEGVDARVSLLLLLQQRLSASRSALFLALQLVVGECVRRRCVPPVFLCFHSFASSSLSSRKAMCFDGRCMEKSLCALSA